MGASTPTNSGIFSYFPCSNYRFFKASVDPTENDCNSDFNDNALAQAQEADESLYQVRKRIRNKGLPKNDELQALPRLGWQRLNQVSSLHIKNNVFCRKFEQLEGKFPFMQRIVPRSMVPEVLTALHSSKTAGHLGTHKVIEKVRLRFYWLDLRKTSSNSSNVAMSVRSNLDPQRPTVIP